MTTTGLRLSLRSALLPVLLVIISGYLALRQDGLGSESSSHASRAAAMPAVAGAQPIVDPRNLIITMSPAGSDARELRLLDLSTNQMAGGLVVGHNPVALI